MGWGSLGVAVALAITLLLLARGGRLRGEYAQANGPGRLEFRGQRVYVTTALGIRFASRYELDGDMVIIKGAAGSQVFTRDGEVLDAGMGIRYVKTTDRGSSIDE